MDFARLHGTPVLNTERYATGTDGGHGCNFRNPSELEQQERQAATTREKILFHNKIGSLSYSELLQQPNFFFRCFSSLSHAHWPCKETKQTQTKKKSAHLKTNIPNLSSSHLKIHLKLSSCLGNACTNNVSTIGHDFHLKNSSNFHFVKCSTTILQKLFKRK